MNSDFYVLCLGMILVTALSRLTPMFFASHRQQNPYFLAFVEHIPVAVFSALVASDVFFKDDKLQITLDNYYLLLCAPVFLVVYFSRSVPLGVLMGVLLLAAFRSLF